MADDEDAIYVDVIPRLDEGAADEASERLRDKFKNAAKGIGEDIKDAAKKAGDGLKDVLGDDLKDAIKGYGKNLRDEIKSGDVGGALEDIRHPIEGVTDLVTGLGRVFGAPMDGIESFGKTITNAISNLEHNVDKVTGKISSFTDGLQAFKSGDYATAVHGLGDAFKGILPDGLMDHASGVIDTFTNTQDTIKNTLKDTTDTALELRAALGLGELGAGGLGATLLGGAGELVLPAAVGAALLAPGGVSDRIGTALFNSDFAGGRSFMYQNLDPTWSGAYTAPTTPNPVLPVSTEGGLPHPAAQAGPGLAIGPMSPASQLPSFAPLDMPDSPANPRNLTGGPTTYTPLSAAGASGGGHETVQAQSATVEAGAATVVAGSVSLGGISLSQVMGAIPTPSTSGGPSVSPARDRALAGMGFGAPTSGGGIGSGSFFGRGSSSAAAPSIAPEDHHSAGGMLPGDSPGYDNMFGQLPGGKTVGLEGGEFMVNPQATQANLSLLQAINSGSLQHFDQGGGPIQQQSMGSGPGISVGGGLLGAAEAGGAMMAGPFAPAAQIAEQETNLAIQEGSKAAAIAAMAPIETLKLGGGQMGAPTVGQGWYGKLAGGIIGQGFNALNTAAAGAGTTTQPPKQPQGQGGDQGAAAGADPLKAGAQAAAQGMKPGPSGHADDPMHVQVANPNPGLPQGAVTSAMNATGVMSAITG